MSSKRLIGWLVAVQGRKDPQQQLYAAVAQRKAAYPSLEYETGHAEALVGDHLSVTNEQVEFQRRLTDGEIARRPVPSRYHFTQGDKRPAGASLSSKIVCRAMRRGGSR
jgi:hypothetical protein